MKGDRSGRTCGWQLYLALGTRYRRLDQNIIEIKKEKITQDQLQRTVYNLHSKPLYKTSKIHSSVYCSTWAINTQIYLLFPAKKQKKKPNPRFEPSTFHKMKKKSKKRGLGDPRQEPGATAYVLFAEGRWRNYP